MNKQASSNEIGNAVALREFRPVVRTLLREQRNARYAASIHSVALLLGLLPGVRTLAPIWLPHWPAWIWTISLILLVRTLSRLTLQESFCIYCDGDCSECHRTSEQRRTWTSASREPRDEYAPVAVSVTDFQVSPGRARRCAGRIRAHRSPDWSNRSPASPATPLSSNSRGTRYATTAALPTARARPDRTPPGERVDSPAGSASPKRLRFVEIQEEPLRRSYRCFQARSDVVRAPMRQPVRFPLVVRGCEMHRNGYRSVNAAVIHRRMRLTTSFVTVGRDGT